MTYSTHHTSFSVDCYADDLEWAVRNRYLTKLLFATIFLIIAVISVVFAAVSRWEQAGVPITWFLVAVVSLLMSFYVSRIPANRRKLIEPAGMNLEINIEDYYWLEQICKQFPTLAAEVKNLLIQNGEINFSDFEKLWIMLGEFGQAKQIEEETHRIMDQTKSLYLLSVSALKRRLMEI